MSVVTAAHWSSRMQRVDQHAYNKLLSGNEWPGQVECNFPKRIPSARITHGLAHEEGAARR